MSFCRREMQGPRPSTKKSKSKSATRTEDFEIWQKKVSTSSQEMFQIQALLSKRTQVKKLAQAQSERNREKIMGRMKNKKFHSMLFPDQRGNNSPTTKFALAHNQRLFEDYITASLENVPAQGLPASTIQRVRKLLPNDLRRNFPDSLKKLWEEVSTIYVNTLGKSVRTMVIANQSKLKVESEDQNQQTILTSNLRLSIRPTWRAEFEGIRGWMLRNLHILHPHLRNALEVCKIHLNATTLSACDSYCGDTIDLDSFCGNIISECEKTEETLMTQWYRDLTQVFRHSKDTSLSRNGAIRKPKLGKRFFQCTSALLSIQLRDMLMRSVKAYVNIFSDKRKLPRIEMELVLLGSKIAFSPSIQEVSQMIQSVLSEMSRLLREVPTIESWLGSGESEFVSVSLDDDFIQSQIQRLNTFLDQWLQEPVVYSNDLVSQFNFLIDGTAKNKILEFIGASPKFEAICEELKVYNLSMEKTQEIASLAYFSFVRLDCEQIRQGLGEAARKLAQILLQNVVDTYRRENQAICQSFEDIKYIALKPPKSTKEMIELGEFMLTVKNKKMISLEEDIENSKKHLLYLIDVHIFSKEDIQLNTRTLSWMHNIRPVFEQNTEIVEDCKAKFEDELQRRSEWIAREVHKLTGRVQELEELGELESIHQYSQEVRAIEGKLKQLEDTVCWVNEEEALFKFPQSTYHDLGDAHSMEAGDGKMRQNISPYARLFGTVLQWQKAQKKWTDGSFLELNAQSIDDKTQEFQGEMDDLQKLFKSKFKQQALDGDSKYGKMNLEDSNPMNLPPPLRICALTNMQIKEFRKNIPLIRCLCNPGIRKRHWLQMSDIIGFDITPNTGSSLRKVLRWNLDPFMEKLDLISVAACREHALELSLKTMKEEWSAMSFPLKSKATEDHMEGIQQCLDDHQIVTQSMKGSPYFKAFEDEVCNWESQLERIQVFLKEWSSLQSGWALFSDFFAIPGIESLVPEEAQRFQDVNNHVQTMTHFLTSHSNVIEITETEGVLDQLVEANDLLDQVRQGIQSFGAEKQKTFARFGLLAPHQTLLLTCNVSRALTESQKVVSILFPGVYALVENEENIIFGVRSSAGESLTLTTPLDLAAYPGRIDQFWSHLERILRVTSKNSILKCLDLMWSSVPADYLGSFPCQSVIMANAIKRTAEVSESIKGGQETLRALKHQISEEVDGLAQALQSSNLVHSHRVNAQSMLVQNMSWNTSVIELESHNARGENDFQWRTKIRHYYSDDSLWMELLNEKLTYCFEFLGDLVFPLTSEAFHRSTFSLLYFFNHKSSPLVGGQPAVGKTTLIRHAAALLGQPLFIRTMTRETGLHMLQTYLDVAIAVGVWFCFKSVDRVGMDVLSTLTRDLMHLESNHRYKESNAFFTFTSNLTGLNGQYMPQTFRRLIRPLCVVQPEFDVMIRQFILGLGLQVPTLRKSDQRLTHQIVSLLNAVNSMRYPGTVLNYDLKNLKKTLSLWKSSGSESSQDLAAIFFRYSRFTCSLDQERALLFTIQNIFDWSSPETCRSHVMRSDVSERIIELAKKLGLTLKESVLGKIEITMEMLQSNRAIILSGPSMTCKSLILELACKLSNISEVEHVYPNCFSNDYLFGHYDNMNIWHEGYLPKILKTSKDKSMVVFHGPLQSFWTDHVEQLLEERQLTLLNGEQLILDVGIRVAFETTSMVDCPPSLLNRCFLVRAQRQDSSWQMLFQQWFQEKHLEASSEQKWRQDNDETIQDLFDWLLPFVTRFMNTHLKDLPCVNLSLFRQCLQIFRRSLNLAMAHLKERKYLKTWVQASLVFALTWSFGNVLDPEARLKFDSALRDVINGKNAAHPLPAILNNKFDAIPPNEGSLFDFCFEYKARGQWKHWSDSLRNLDVVQFIDTKGLFIPTIESVRLQCLHQLTNDTSMPFLLLGASGIGKSSVMQAKLQGIAMDTGSSVYSFRVVTNSTSMELVNWLSSRLIKRYKNRYVPEKEGGVVFIDDMTSCQEYRQFNEQLIQIQDQSSWVDFISLEKCSLESSKFMACALFDHDQPTHESRLNARLLSRFHLFRMQELSMDSLNRVFSQFLHNKFKDNQFSPEISSVIPGLVQSTLRVYESCRQDLDQGSHSNLSRLRLPPPHLRELFRLSQNVSYLSKELAENKKIFTRLWVFETLRHFYDRLQEPQARTSLIQEIRNCVKTIFRENFDSAFEHLGKVNGKVTEVNLRNLVFDRFQSVETRTTSGDEDNQSKESQGNDSHEVETEFGVKEMPLSEIENLTQSKLKIYNENVAKINGGKVVNLLPVRYLYEMVATLHHVLRIPGGNALLLGNGGEDRQVLTRISTILAGQASFLVVKTSPRYGIDEWRKDIGEALKNVAKYEHDLVIFATLAQLQAQPFCLSDLESLLKRGEIFNIFSPEENNEINEIMHHRLMNNARGRNVLEVTPSALFDNFIALCQSCVHVFVSVNEYDQEAGLWFRNCPSVVRLMIPIICQPWPEDAMLRACDVILEQTNLERDRKRTIYPGFKAIHDHFGLMVQNQSLGKSPGLTTSPKLFVRCLQLFANKLESLSAEATQKEHSHKQAQKKYDQIGKQCQAMSDEIKILGESLRELESKLAEFNQKRQEANNLLEEYNGKLVLAKQKENHLTNERERLRVTYQEAVLPLEFNLQEKKKKVSLLKVTELSNVAKGLRTPNEPLKLLASALCILFDDQPNAYAAKDGNILHRKVKDAREQTKPDVKQEADPWTVGKKILSDLSLIDKLTSHVDMETHSVQIELVANLILSDPSWDPTSFAKGPFYSGEPIALLMEAWCKLYRRQQEIKPQLDTMDQLELDIQTAHNVFLDLREQCGIIQDQLVALEKDIDQLEENTLIKKKDQDQWKTKHDRAVQLCGSWSAIQEVFNENLNTSQHQVAHLVAASMIFASSLTYCITLSGDIREDLRFKIRETASKLAPDILDPFRDYLPQSKEECKFVYEYHGLVEDLAFRENITSVRQSARWSWIEDPHKTCLGWIRAQSINHKEPVIRSHAALVQESYVSLLQALRSGRPLIVLDMNSPDSILEDVIGLKKRDPSAVNNEATQIQLLGQSSPVHEEFRLYLICPLRSPSSPLKLSSVLQNICQYTNFALTRFSLQRHFLGAIVTKECKELQEKVLHNELLFYESNKDATRRKNDIFAILEEVDSKLVEDSLTCSKLVGLFQETQASLDTAQKAQHVREDCIQMIEAFSPLAQRVSTLFQAISRLSCLDPNYVYGKSWLLDILSHSIVSSNKSKNLKRRISFIRDHFTFSVFSRASFAISSEHRLVLAFFIACHMLIEKGSLIWTEMELFAHFWASIKEEFHLKRNLHSQKLRKFLQCYEDTTQQVKGILQDIEKPSSPWKLFIDAKEPDNLPLPEPWYSRLNKFHRLLIIGSLRPDKILELAESFVNDIIGYMFLQIKPLDLKKVLSDLKPTNPAVFFSNPSSSNSLANFELLEAGQGGTTDGNRYYVSSESQIRNLLRFAQNKEKNDSFIMVLENASDTTINHHWEKACLNPNVVLWVTLNKAFNKQQ